MHASDGVSKFFLVYHEYGSLHFEGEKSLLDMADMVMRKYMQTLETEQDCEAALEELTTNLRKTFKSWYDEISESDEEG